MSNHRQPSAENPLSLDMGYVNEDTYLVIEEHEFSNAIALGAVQDASGRLYVPSDLSLVFFRSWLPGAKSTQLSEIVKSPSGISLSMLLAKCTAAIKSSFSDAIWVRFEVSQLKFSGGHLYLGAIERSEGEGATKELAKTTAMIWSKNVTKLVNKFSSATKMELSKGIHILVLVKPEFHPQFGLSLQITDIDPSYTIGDLEIRLKEIREKLEASGDARKNIELPSPDDFFHVGVISPAGAAGLEDFQAEANVLEAAGLCRFTYFEAIFQGDKTKDSIKNALVSAHIANETTPFCALVIIRGGGASADLHWLDEFILARLVCRFHCPVFTGIGHEKDKSILDEYANRSFGTPSKVIGFIRDAITKKAMMGFENWTSISHSSMSKLDLGESKIKNSLSEIHIGVDRKLVDVDFESQKMFDAIINTSKVAIQSAESKVEHDFASVTLAARRSIDGVDDHLDTQFQTVVASAIKILNTGEVESNKCFEDVRFYANKNISDAETSARDLMSGILAHGVGPTLQRGFAMVKNESGTVSTKESAENSKNLEIVFRDGSIRVR